MAGSLLLSLHPSGAPRSSKETLKDQIEQIKTQSGGFRNVDEQSLLEEIKNSPRRDDDVDMQDGDDEVDDTPESRRQALWKGREEMLPQLDRARNDILTALDFVSLLLSKHTVTVQSTMSPVLKEAVPVGSVDARVVKFAAPTQSEEKKTNLVSRGWKMHTFNAVAENLAQAGSRLRTEAENESRYWEQVTGLQYDGWAVSRLPRDSRNVGVHFGFADSAPAFRSRGFAMLWRGGAGDLMLDKSVLPPNPVSVTVDIIKQGQVTGSSRIGLSHAAIPNTIREEISQARDTLFEEELFHELGREGRILANRGVDVSETDVKFTIGDQTVVQLSLARSTSDRAPPDATRPDDHLATGVALSMRLLLIHAHIRNAQKRSQPPPPMNSTPSTTPEYAILRPIMCNLRHDQHVCSVRQFLETTGPPMKRAGLNNRTTCTPPPHFERFALLSSSEDMSMSLVRALTQPIDTRITLTMPTSRILDIQVHSYLGPPNYGTDFSIEPLDYSFGQLKAPHMTSVADVKSFICHALMVDITIWLENFLNEKQETMGWAMMDIHNGELSHCELHDSTAKMQVKVLDDTAIAVRYISRPRSGSSNGEISTFLWEADRFWKGTAGRRTVIDSQTLSEAVQELLHRKGPEA